MTHVASGLFDRVLTIAFEKQSEGNAMWALSPTLPFTPPLVAGAGGFFAPYCRAYIKKTGAPPHIGPVTAAKVGRWLDHGRFDVLHIHEPMSPSVSVLALMAADGPIVGTFHTSMLRSRTMQTAYPIVRPSLEKISARIAVSEDARRTVTTQG